MFNLGDFGVDLHTDVRAFAIAVASIGGMELPICLYVLAVFPTKM
jgi:hypothetical protein